MNRKTEIVMPKEMMAETESLLDIAKRIPPEKQAGLRDFLRGVSYGLDMATAGQSRSGERREGA